MTPETVLTALQDRDVMIPLMCSLVAGGLIGAERELNRKPAGIRTHTLLCFAAALMTILGLRMAEWVAYLPAGTQVVSDMSRMPHAILTGVGFLGAGVIFREGGSVQGLTTAASLWLTAALGIVFGTGLLGLGLVGAAITVLVLVVLRVFQWFAPPSPVARLEVELTTAATLTVGALEELLARQGIRCGAVGYQMDQESGMRRYETLLSSRRPLPAPEAIAARVQEAGGVHRLVIAPLTLDSAQFG